MDSLNQNKDSYFEDPKLEALLESCKMVIFDMNGTIIDDEKFHFISLSQTFKEIGIDLTQHYWIFNMIGKKLPEHLPEILQDFNREITEEEGIQFINRKDEIYYDLVIQQVKEIVRKGIVELIQYLSDRPSKFKLAVATSAGPKEVVWILGEDALNLKHYFHYVVTNKDVYKSKPDPSIFLKASDLAAIPPEECLVLEDSYNGVTAADRANMKSLVAPHQFTKDQDFSAATYVVDHVGRDAKIIKQQEKK